MHVLIMHENRVISCIRVMHERLTFFHAETESGITLGPAPSDNFGVKTRRVYSHAKCQSVDRRIDVKM